MSYDRLDAWIDAHFDEQVRMLQELVRVPTDTPPGNNAPHAERTAQLLQGFGLVLGEVQGRGFRRGRGRGLLISHHFFLQPTFFEELTPRGALFGREAAGTVGKKAQ